MGSIAFLELSRYCSAEWSKVFILMFITRLAYAQPNQDISHNYFDANGPQSWGGSCNTGAYQSPINIRANTSPLDTSLPVPPVTNYSTYGSSGILYNNGYSPEIVPLVPGSFGSFKIGSKVYAVTNFHFHEPAEHSINGIIWYALEMQIEHKSAEGDIAMISVFFTQTSTQSPFLNKILPLLPQIAGVGTTPVSIPNVILDKPLGQHVRYTGSLTTPPCTEGVVWTVMLNPLPMTTAQLNLYKASFPRASARITQPLNGRIARKSPVS